MTRTRLAGLLVTAASLVSTMAVASPDLSPACSAEFARTLANESGTGTTDDRPPPLWFLSDKGKPAGPMDVFDLKRRLLEPGFGPTSFVIAAGGTVWSRAADVPELQTPPPGAVLSDDLDPAGLRAHFAGCWVSENMPAPAGKTVRVMLILTAGRVYHDVLTHRQIADGAESYSRTLSENPEWAVERNAGRLELVLRDSSLFMGKTRLGLEVVDANRVRLRMTDEAWVMLWRM